MPIRIYRAPQIGTGTIDNPFRSILNTFIDIRHGDWFDEIDNPSTKHSICTVHAGQSVHDAIYNDRLLNPGRIVYLSDLVPTELEKKMKLLETFNDKQKSFKDEVIKVLKDEKIDDSKIKSTWTVKDVLRLYIENSFSEQRLAAKGTPVDWTKAKFKFSGEDF